MSTLEEQLRTTLSARAEAVTESMLTQSLATLETDPEPDAAPVLLVPPHRLHPPRRLVAAAVAVAAVLLVAFGAVGLHRTAGNKAVGPADIRPRSAIPWDQVGTGWMLQIAEPGTVDVPGGTDGWLYLIDPDGVLYAICKVPQEAYRYQFPKPTAWGQPFNEDRVILMQPIDNGRSSLLEIDLRSGGQHAVTVLGHWSSAEYVDAGASILLNGVSKMVTVSADTGEIETNFEGSSFFGSIISPDRRQVVSGSDTIVAVLDIGTGRIVNKLAEPSGYNFCIVVSWLPGTTRFAARCQQIAQPKTPVLFDFSLDGSTSPVRPNVPAGWNEVDLADGKIAINPGRSAFYRINEMSFARLSSTGRLEPIVVPAEFKHGSWTFEFLTPTGLILENTSPDGDSTDELVVWNPLTGQVKELFRTVGKGGPDGLWAGWRDS